MPVLRYKRDATLDRIKSCGLLCNKFVKYWTPVVDDVFDTFFTNVNTDDSCPINDCKLMTVGCEEEAPDDHVRIAKVSGKNQWKLDAWVYRPYGFNDAYCIKCTNGDKTYPRESITYDNYRVTLPSKCTYAMEVKETAKTEVDFIHDDFNSDVGAIGKPSKATSQDLDFNDFFVNNDRTYCPVESCKLLE